MVYFGLLLISACGGEGPENVSWLENAPDIIQDSADTAHPAVNCLHSYGSNC